MNKTGSDITDNIQKHHTSTKTRTSRLTPSHTQIFKGTHGDKYANRGTKRNKYTNKDTNGNIQTQIVQRQTWR